MQREGWFGLVCLTALLIAPAVGTAGAQSSWIPLVEAEPGRCVSVSRDPQALFPDAEVLNLEDVAEVLQDVAMRELSPSGSAVLQARPCGRVVEVLIGGEFVAVGTPDSRVPYRLWVKLFGLRALVAHQVVGEAPLREIEETFRAKMREALMSAIRVDLVRPD